jgi:hypothetical protein
VVQSPGGWSNREDPIPQRSVSQQIFTPASQHPSQLNRASARPSQISQTAASRRSAAGSQQAIDEEEDHEDDEEDDMSEDNSFVDYYPEYAPPPSSKPKGPRAETADDYETCSCFPKRKNKNIPSMLYENITCVHTGLKGQPHAGVFRFEDNWIERDVRTAQEQKENKKKSKKQRKLDRPKMKHVYGYPKPVLPAFSDDEEGEGDDDDQEEYDDDDILSDDEMDAVSTRSKRQTQSRKSKSESKNKKKQQKKEDNDTGVEEMDDDDYDDEEEDEEPQGEITREEAYYPVLLPQIGHSPPPSRERTRHSARSQPALPPLPESPFMTTQKKKEKQKTASIKPTQSFRSDQRDDLLSRESGRHSAPDIRNSPSPRPQKLITKTRRFQGVYYDPGTFMLKTQ